MQVGVGSIVGGGKGGPSCAAQRANHGIPGIPLKIRYVYRIVVPHLSFREGCAGAAYQYLWYRSYLGKHVLRTGVDGSDCFESPPRKHDGLESYKIENRSALEGLL